MITPKVFFLCSSNSCRTQMAEGLLRDLAGDRFEITSAGDTTAPVDSDAVDAMRKLGIDISGHQSKSVSPLLGGISKTRLLLPITPSPFGVSATSSVSESSSL
jgi:protein-tyrosine-phosphatase